MHASVSLFVAAFVLCPAGQAIAQEKFVPSTISEEAAAIIKETSPGKSAPASAEEWQAAWEENEVSSKPENEEALKKYPAKIEKLAIAGEEHLLLTPGTYTPDNEKRILVYIHGGAHTFYSPDTTLINSAPAAHYARTKLLAVRYPLAWQKPHPASRDLVVAVYQKLLKTYAPRRIAMYGDSAGGALLMSAVLKMRDDGLPMPAVLGLISPWADITKTGDSLTLLQGADPILDYDLNLKAAAETYATGQDLKDPSISPLYADFKKGFPPSYISTGTRDLFLSHCARLQRKLIDAGIDNQLVLYEGMWHVFQGSRIPEEKDAWLDLVAFLKSHWAR
jgi:acetyl esterase/lipase